MTKPTCTWADGRWTAVGGEACNEAHCAMRGRCANHVKPEAGVRTCGACIGRTRRDLAAIVELATLMAFDALADGVESEAMNLIGPAASPEQIDARRALDERRGWCEYPPVGVREDDPHHPYAVLTRWALAMEDGGWLTYSDLRMTLAGAQARLSGALDRFAHGDEFEDFAAEVAACRAHLEAVDHDSRTPQQGRPCPACEENGIKPPKLQKRYAKHQGYAPGQRCGIDKCDICAGNLDAWHCPVDPSHAWTETDYTVRVKDDYRRYAEELPVLELAERLGVKPIKIRKWCSRIWDQRAGEYREPLLVSRRKGPDGRKVYPVKVAEKLLEDERMSA